MAQQKKNLTNNHEVVGLIPGLTQWVKDSLAVPAPVQHLVWEFPYASGTTLKKSLRYVNSVYMSHIFIFQADHQPIWKLSGHHWSILHPLLSISVSSVRFEPFNTSKRQNRLMYHRRLFLWRWPYGDFLPKILLFFPALHTQFSVRQTVIDVTAVIVAANMEEKVGSLWKADSSSLT